MPRYTVCPYYVDESKKTISCEDTIRRFASVKSKGSHMDKFCDRDWKQCKYAIALTEMYQQLENAKDPEKVKLRHKVRVLSKEHKKLISLLGRYDVRLDAKDAEIRYLRKKVKEAEDAWIAERRRRKSGEEREQEGLETEE